MIQALGEDKARSMLSKVMPDGAKTRGIEALKWMDARSVAELIEEEHPQIIAIVLASLDEDHAAAVLTHLPEGTLRRCHAACRPPRNDRPGGDGRARSVLEKQLGKVAKSPPRWSRG
jgi:flagellar motor switch protein FliG